MHIIEPCCAKRHMMKLRDALRNGGTLEFEGYGDVSLTEILPAVLNRYCSTRLLIAAPAIPDQAAETILQEMRRSRARVDGQGRLDVVSRLIIVADLSGGKSPMAHRWLKDNPFGDRLTLIDRASGDTVVILPDFAIEGPVNLRYGEHFTAMATTDQDKVDALWKEYLKEDKEEAPAEAPADADVTHTKPVKAGSADAAGKAPDHGPAATAAEAQAVAATGEAEEGIPGEEPEEKVDEAGEQEAPRKEASPKKGQPGPEAGLADAQGAR